MKNLQQIEQEEKPVNVVGNENQTVSAVGRKYECWFSDCFSITCAKVATSQLPNLKLYARKHVAEVIETAVEHNEALISDNRYARQKMKILTAFGAKGIGKSRILFEIKTFMSESSQQSR